MNYEFLSFLSCNKTRSFFPHARSACMENIYFNTTPASEVKFHGGLQSEVNAPNLICLFCFIFREAHFPPTHQLGNKRERKRRWGWGVGIRSKNTASYTAHEAVSSSLDPVLTPRMMEWLLLGEVCVCVSMYSDCRWMVEMIMLSLYKCQFSL